MDETQLRNELTNLSPPVGPGPSHRPPLPHEASVRVEDRGCPLWVALQTSACPCVCLARKPPPSHHVESCDAGPRTQSRIHSWCEAAALGLWFRVPQCPDHGTQRSSIPSLGTVVVVTVERNGKLRLQTTWRNVFWHGFTYFE